MELKHSYPTSAQLDAVVLEIYRAGIPYADAVRKFKKQFILTALRQANWNESKAAPVLRMHRNTLRRTLRQLNLDARALRKAERRQVRRVKNSPAEPVNVANEAVVCFSRSSLPQFPSSLRS